MKPSKSIVWINVFTAKPGKLDELVAIQAEELLNFKSKGVPGWISSRWHRSVDNNKAIMVTTFENIEFHKSWLEKMTFLNT
ncbi:antibiotic biosynthesis monooxygenase [Bacillus sp. OVS6]|nr:antibiotic biosynthesis monooxygenase [Bacillus sp. OVS6]